MDNFLHVVQQSSAIPKTSVNGIFCLNFTSLLTKTKTNVLLAIIFCGATYFLLSKTCIYTLTYVEKRIFSIFSSLDSFDKIKSILYFRNSLSKQSLMII